MHKHKYEFCCKLSSRFTTICIAFNRGYSKKLSLGDIKTILHLWCNLTQIHLLSYLFFFYSVLESDSVHGVIEQ